MRGAGRISAAVLTLAAILLLSSITTAPEREAPPPTPTATAEPISITAAAPIPARTPTPTPEPTPTPTRYAGITLSEEDVETLASLVWLEARGEPFDGQVAVVEVVLNRILSPSFPDTVDEVVYQRDPLQFSPSALIPTTTPTEEQYRAVETALAAAEPITDADVVYFSTSAQNGRVYATIGAHVFCRE